MLEERTFTSWLKESNRRTTQRVGTCLHYPCWDGGHHQLMGCISCQVSGRSWKINHQDTNASCPHNFHLVSNNATILRPNKSLCRHCAASPRTIRLRCGLRFSINNGTNSCNQCFRLSESRHDAAKRPQQHQPIRYPPSDLLRSLLLVFTTLQIPIALFEANRVSITFWRSLGPNSIIPRS